MNKMFYSLFALLLSSAVYSQNVNKTDSPQELSFDFHYTGIFTGYDLQSLGTPQQIWQDPNNPFNVHAVFIYSPETSGWLIRKSLYIYSSDMGASWTNMGFVQTSSSARGGFASISGLIDGRPIVGLHTNDSTELMRTQIYVRNIQDTIWARYDPGNTSFSEPLYPNVLGIGNDQVYFATLSDGVCLNSLTVSTASFNGYSCNNTYISGESYKLEKSEDESIIGLAYLGDNYDSVSFGNVYYRESIDGGLTWSNPVTAFQYDYEDSLGSFTGLDIIYLQNIPYIVFETVKKDFSSSSYYPSEPNKIMLWSPAVNNGEAIILAESGVNVPYNPVYPAYLSNDHLVPVSRPTIGRSAAGNALFVVFNVVTEHIFHWNNNSTSYSAGYFMYSLDEGHNWTAPVKFTPDSPVLDWRFFSISPTNAVSLGDCHLQISAEVDSVPGSLYPPPLIWLTAQFCGITTSVSLSGLDDDSNIPAQFSLSQNYPNPFNPSTTINYNIPSGTMVTLTVYNVLGQKVREMVNEYKSPGEYEVKVDMQEYNSGIYFYKFQAGGYVETKKMILLK